MSTPHSKSWPRRAGGPNDGTGHTDGQDDPTDPNSGPEACDKAHGVWMVSNCWGNACDDFPGGGGGGSDGGGPNGGTGVDVGPVPTTVCSIIGPDGEDSALICTQQGAGAPGGGAGNGGPTIGPSPPPKPSCRIVDPFLNAIEFTVKAGLETKVSSISVGGSIYKNLMTGQTGTEASLNFLNLIGAEANRPGMGSGGSAEVQAHFAFFKKNLSTGEKKFEPASGLFRIGLVLGIGFEISFNANTFDATVAANEQCTKAGGK
jgi:hypothetical protein